MKIHTQENERKLHGIILLFCQKEMRESSRSPEKLMKIKY
jgi:hypothetical protein